MNTDTDIIPYGYKILPAPSGFCFFFVSRVSPFQTNTKASLRRTPVPLCIRRCVGKSSSRPKWVRRRMSSRVSTPSTSPRRSTVSPSRRGLPVLWLRCVEERTSHHHAGFFLFFFPTCGRDSIFILYSPHSNLLPLKQQVKKFASKVMKTSDVRVDVKLNKHIWSKGIRNVRPSCISRQ